MTVTEPPKPPIPQKSPVMESVRNIIGAWNTAITLTTVACMAAAFNFLFVFSDPPKTIALVALAVGIKYLFFIKKLN